MAMPLRFLALLRVQTSTKIPFVCVKRPFSRSSKRLLLSESYSCNEAWKKHLKDPSLTQVSLSEFGYQVRDQLQQSGHVSAVDMNVLAHQLDNMDDDEADFMEDLLAKFNMCQSSVLRNDSTFHAIVRGFLSKSSDGAPRLARLLGKPLQYGLFPDHYSLNLLLDRLIVTKAWASAAKIAYHTLLQEELGTHPSHTLLCLYTAVQRLHQGPVSDLAPVAPEQTEGEGEEEEEEDWIKVDYIKYPVYDDHFDIKDERFLLGKTLHTLAQVQNVDIPDQIRTNVSLIGSGTHHKFQQGLSVLESILSSPSDSVSQHALDSFSESLEAVETRDPEEPEVEIAIRTVDDVIHRLLPTTTEKADYQSRLVQLTEQITSMGKVMPDFDLLAEVSTFVKSELPKLESADVDAQLQRLDIWQRQREVELESQVQQIRQAERVEEMKRQVRELQEQEELLSFFDNEEKIRLTFLEADVAKDENLTISK